MVINEEITLKVHSHLDLKDSSVESSNTMLVI
jgi:hypothetical protein